MNIRTSSRTITAVAALALVSLSMAACAGGSSDVQEADEASIADGAYGSLSSAYEFLYVEDGTVTSVSITDFGRDEDARLNEVLVADTHSATSEAARESSLQALRDGKIAKENVPELTAERTTLVCDEAANHEMAMRWMKDNDINPDELEPEVLQHNIDSMWDFGCDDELKVEETKSDTHPIYAVGSVGEIHEDGTGIIWDGDITDIVKLQIDVPVKGAFTLGSVIYAEIDSDEYKNS